MLILNYPRDIKTNIILKYAINSNTWVVVIINPEVRGTKKKLLFINVYQ